MRRNRNQISFLFLAIVGLVIIFLIYYIMLPSKNGNKKTKETYLEYNTISETAPNTPEYTKKTRYYTQETETEETEGNYEIKPIQRSKTAYRSLLKELQEYPKYSENSIEQIVNKLLIYKGYRSNSIEVIFKDITKTTPTAQSSYPVAQFEFTKGDIVISKEMVYQEDIKTIIAIIAHELDHFEKIAMICKGMGSEEFFKFLEGNNIKEVNKGFWRDIEKQTDIVKEDITTYKEALKRYINQNKMELTSSYSDYYRLSEGMRNPLEISAYNVSDEVYKYYGIPIEEGPIRKISKAFNEVDWAIYEAIKSNKDIEGERIAIFDYCYAKAIIKLYSEYKDIYERCIREDKGDLTKFWLKFESTLKGLYGKGVMSNEEVNRIIKILNETKQIAKEGLSKEEIKNALYYKAELIKSNLVYPDAQKILRETGLNLLKYMKSEGIEDSEKELEAIITLINIENGINTKETKEISLYYIKLPEEFNKIYKIANKHKRFHIIYDNESYKNKFKEAQETNPSLTEQQYLIEMLEKNRLNVKI